MLDFKTELDKLLALETEPLPDVNGGLAEVLTAGRELLSRFDKKQTDISMQVEEIYDLVQENDTTALQEALRDGKKRVNRLVSAVIGLCDIIEDFKEYAAHSSDEALARQALMMWRNTDRLLEECGMARIDEPGAAGQPLEPSIHAVQAVTPSGYPREHVARVLRSGYRHMGEVARKAAVIVSSGTEGFLNE